MDKKKVWAKAEKEAPKTEALPQKNAPAPEEKGGARTSLMGKMYGMKG